MVQAFVGVLGVAGDMFGKVSDELFGVVLPLGDLFEVALDAVHAAQAIFCHDVCSFGGGLLVAAPGEIVKSHYGVSILQFC